MASIACSDNSDSLDLTGTDEEFCQRLWDEGPRPTEIIGQPAVTEDVLIKDCLEGLDGGYSREQVISIYENLAEQS